MLRRLLVIVLIVFLFTTPAGCASLRTFQSSWSAVEKAAVRMMIATLLPLAADSTYGSGAEIALNLLWISRNAEEQEVIRHYLELR